MKYILFLWFIAAIISLHLWLGLGVQWWAGESQARDILALFWHGYGLVIWPIARWADS